MHASFLTALLFLASPTAAEGSPASAEFTDLMAVMDAGDEARLRSWVLENFTAAMLRANPGDPGIAQFLVDQQRNLGGFEVQGILKSQPSQVEMQVRARQGARRWLRYVVNVEPEPPHRIAGIFVFPMAGEVLPAEGEPLTREAAVAALEKEIDRLVDDGKFSGAVLLAKDGKPVLRKAWGAADRSFHAPNRPDTLFNLGSLNKMFTAVAIGRLVEEGKVAWDDPVSRHVKEWLRTTSRRRSRSGTC